MQKMIIHKLLQRLLVSAVFLCIVGCSGEKVIRVIILKDGAPLTNSSVSYSELSKKIGTEKHTATTAENGEFEVTLTRENQPIAYYVSLVSDDESVDIARGGFSGSSRVAKWVEDRYKVSFK